jgi:hypothetical protein
MADTKQHPCDDDCGHEHSPKFSPRGKLDEGDKAEPKHTESGLVPLIPTGG